jgi:hypothetical protein
VLGDPKGARDGSDHLRMHTVGRSCANWVCEQCRGRGQGIGMGWGERVVQVCAQEWEWRRVRERGWG